MEPFSQGYLDSLCGVYSIVNAERIVNNSTVEQSQELFNELISYLSKKRILRRVLIEGVEHRTMTWLMNDVVGGRIAMKLSNKKGICTLGEWWKYSVKFLENENAAIILSVGGRESHLTVTNRITRKKIFLVDSNWRTQMRREDCSITYDIGKSVIYPAQCWYLGR